MGEKLFFLLFCIFVALSCNRKDYEHIECSIKTMEDNIRVLDTSIIKEMYYPCDIYSVGDDILVINENKDKKIMYQYNLEFSFKGAFFSYGRSGNEFTFIGRNLRDGTDSTLFLYTDWFNCTKFLLDDHGVRVAGKFRILNDAQNDVIILNDSLVFYRALQKNAPCHVYNYVSDELVCEFGEFPRSSIEPETDADRDNICLFNSVYDKINRLLVSFYESIPIIRIYDMVTYDLVREIQIVDGEKQTKSLDDYYEGEGIVYFLRPMIVGNNIYSLFLNTRSDDKFIEQTILIKMDLNGNIVSKYVLDRFCPIYTVSNDGIFYGISISNGEYVLCKTYL